MKITFYSNYLTHHQLPFCRALQKITDDNFVFVATKPIRPERLDLGYEDMNQMTFVVRAYEGEDKRELAKNLALESDVMIHGSAPEYYAAMRINKNKLLFRYSERILKKGVWHAYTPRAIKNLYLNHRRYRNKQVYMLCASAYTASDYARAGAYLNKTYKWGYFPETMHYANIDQLIEAKEHASILWVARLIELKHPEVAIQIAKRLKGDGYNFNLNIIGNGILEKTLNQQISAGNLSDCVHMLGSMKPEQVRVHMEKSQVFLFTSDFNEGWGAVLNESMNCGCAVVASHAIGSVPFLINDRKNGLIYKNGDIDDLYNKVKWLLDNGEKSRELGVQAYRTITSQWNAENAASRLLKLSEAILNGNLKPQIFDDGVCSKANILNNRWYKTHG